jgi:hypothetical protein
MGALRGARGGVDIPDSDRRPVYDHLSKHYAEFDREPPDFKLVALAASVRAASQPEALKVGRVLSAANLGRLKDAIDVLREILASAEPLPEDDSDKALTEQLAIALAIRERELALMQ